MRTENLYEPNCIRTNSGVYFNLLEPTAEMIKIEDIAHALSRLPRFGGHLNPDWTVAQHSMQVAYHCKQHRLEALLHDASEAYLMDLPTPIKKLIPDYYAMEERINLVIAAKFNLVYPWPEEVKRADQLMLETEWNMMMISSIAVSDGHRSDLVKHRFIQQFYQYKTP
jgi:hypothetical protein